MVAKKGRHNTRYATTPQKTHHNNKSHNKRKATTPQQKSQDNKSHNGSYVETEVLLKKPVGGGNALH